MPPAPPPEKPPPPPNPPNPPPPSLPPHPPPKPPLPHPPPPPPQPRPPRLIINGMSKSRPRLRMISRMMTASRKPNGMPGFTCWSAGGGGLTNSGFESVTPNSPANAWAMRSTPRDRPFPYTSRARNGIIASRMRPARASVRHPDLARRPVTNIGQSDDGDLAARLLPNLGDDRFHVTG
ncbi:MAG: hypothetical protein DMD48_10380 [Gemmatimonadetes bacterium]|nr:MAG: hypothetical protein DMD48_10380 [Gemmatimonadota bacterium]